MEQQLHTDLEFLCNSFFEEGLLQLVKSLVTSSAEARDLVLWPKEVLSIFVEAVEDGLKGRFLSCSAGCLVGGLVCFLGAFSRCCLLAFLVGSLVFAFVKGLFEGLEEILAGFLVRVIESIFLGVFLEESSEPASVGDFMESLQ